MHREIGIVATSSKQQFNKQILIYLPLIALALLGISFVLYYSRYGAGLDGDATRYILGAMNILAGNGYSYISGGGEIVPITTFPPFFPLVLAGLGATGMDLFVVARMLNAILFGVAIFLSGYLVFRHNQSLWTAIIASALIVVSPTLVELFGWSMSDPLFIVLMLVAILGFHFYLEQEKPWALIMTGVLVGLACITRYAGLALVIGIALSVLFLSRLDWKQRILRTLAVSVLGVAPLAVWTWRNSRQAGTLANRAVIFHPMRGEVVRQYFEELASWLIPMQLDLPRIRYRLFLAGVVLVIGIILFYYPKLKQKSSGNGKSFNTSSKMPAILLLIIIGYLMVLILNSTYLDAWSGPGIPSRYLAPVFFLVVILVASFVSLQLSNRNRFSPSWIGAIVLLLFLIALNGSQTVEIISDPTMKLGYVTAKMYWTDEIQALEQIDASQTIVSNNIELTYILSGRSSYMIPIRFNPNNLQANEDFSAQIELTRERLSDNGVLVIYGYGELGRETQIVVEQLEAEPQQILNMAKIYVLP
jgi:4-amino-4-deoxy-L-arabinose transferase-like glycosyltransferase